MKSNQYYRVGISGHRDLLPSDIEGHLARLKEYLLELKEKDKELLILTSLADGADRLIVRVAMELQIPYDVILPMPEELYMEDFSKESQEEFLFFLENAHAQETIKMYAANTYNLVSQPSIHRNFQYRQVGRRVVDMSNEMIIMADGHVNNKIGGTNDIENYAKVCGKIIYMIRCKRLCA